MPVQPYDFNIDPRERVEREQRRLQRLTDPKTYAPGASRRQPRMRRGSEAFELDEEARQGLLSTIGENTMGALYKFSNVLDLPGSSIRDIASTVTGTPRNPFDQWLSPTTERGRIRGRELNRQWGLAGDEDNWKNLIGGMATEIGLDPLTYLGFGANALTKHGQLLKRAGVLDQLPSYRYWKGVERAGDKASPLSTMGKREALQEITNAEDLIKHIGRGADDVGDVAMQQQAREAVEQAAKSVGYGSYEDFLAKEGQEALSGITRFGLPNWRIFGAKPQDMLRQSPGKILGTPGSEGAKRYARTMDEALRKIGEFTPMRHLRPNFDPRLAAMLSPIGQRAAPAYKAAEEAGEATARRLSRDAVMDFQRVFGDDWKTLQTTSSDKEILDIHDRFRSFFEMGNTAKTPEQRQAVDSLTKAISTEYKRARDRGVGMELLDDDFIDYFPRELSEGLDSGWIDQLRELDPTSPKSLPTSAFSQHQLARIGPLRDLPEGTKTIDTLWTDPKAVEIKAKDIPREEKAKELAKYISDTYGQGGSKTIPNQYRGITLNRTNLDSLPPVRRDEIRGMQAEIYKENAFSDIYQNPNIDEVTKKQLIDTRLREMNVRTDTNYLRDPNVAAEIAGDTRLWELRNNRHQVLADMFLNSPEKAHERGLFGNLPLYDAENYFQRMEDAINRSDFTQSMLSHPHALRKAEAGDVGGESLRKVLRDLSLDEDVVIPRLAKQHGIIRPSGMTDEAWRQVLDRFADRTVEMGLNRDLKRYRQLFEGPEAANFAINIYDNMQKVFKAHVTSPWPAFHGRNIMTGLLREAMQGRFSFRDAHDTFRALAGDQVRDATQIPFVQQRWADMQQRIPALSGQKLTDDQAHRILMSAAGETDLVGSYQLHEGADAVTEMRAMGGVGAEQAQLPAGAGRARFFEAETPGSFPFSVPHALRSYVGMGQKIKRPLAEGGFETIKAAPTTTWPVPQVTPFPNVDLPFWAGRKGIAKGYKALRGEEALRGSSRLSQWADEPFWRQPREWRVPGVDESLGAKGREGMKFSELPDSRTYGPVAGGREFAYGAEFINRFEPWLNLVRKGWDPHMAAREIGGSAGSQISYASKHFTPFEQQWMKRIIPFYCVPDNYEILTRRGWKTCDDVEPFSDEALTLNHETGVLEWQPIQAVNTFDYDDDLLVHQHKKKSRTIEWAFTPNHRWPVVTPSERTRNDDGTIGYGYKREFRTGNQLRGDCFVPSAGDFQGTSSCLSPRHAAILGWIVTDGHWRRRKKPSGKSYSEALIYQSPGKHLEEIESLTGNERRKPHPETGVCGVNVSAADLAEIEKVCQCRKDLPGVVTQLSREAADAMWDAMFKAEGSTSDKGNAHFAQYDDDVSDAFQILSFMTGRSAHRSGNGCYVRRSRGFYLATNGNLTRRHYKGRVWCPTTPNGTWIMRHDGAAIITGNSFTSRSVPWSIRKFYEEPHNPLAQIIRGTKRAGEQLQEQHQDVGPVPAYLRDTLAIPLPSEFPDTKRFFTGMDVMSQDLWQLGMPLMSGQADETLFETASRINPLLKFLAESVTGTSLWQRGVEEGRPIRTMSPTVGRTIANLGQSWEKLSGEDYPSGYYDRLSQPGLLDRVASSSPYTRLLSTVRTLADVRKGPTAKALRLGLGAGITDVSPRQQQAIIREYLRSMIGESGGTTFEKATFSKEDLARMDPRERHRALQLKALSDEQAEVAKDLREKARMGLPGY